MFHVTLNIFREPLAKTMGFKVVVTLFSSREVQRIAEKAGYIILAKIPYEELSENFPPWEFHKGNTKFQLVTYKIFD